MTNRTLIIIACVFPASLFFSSGTAVAQNVVIHHSVVFEDGTKRDGDGHKDSSVTWSAGKTHLVAGRISVPNGFTLKIQSGAVVKFADDIQADTNDVLKTWKAPSDAGLAVDPPFNGRRAGVLIIDGATLTDIRDDDEGADDNGDGDASTPTAPASSMAIRFGGTTDDVLRGSTIKYFYKIGHFGSIEISGNHFKSFGVFATTSSYPLNTEPMITGACPVITQNTFELTPNGSIDLRGYSAAVSGNTFQGTNSSSAALVIGLKHTQSGTSDGKSIEPLGGVTSVTRNTFNTRMGVEISAYDTDSLFSKAQFVAQITGNTFKVDSGDGQVAIGVVFDADARITDNLVNGYSAPIVIKYDRASNIAPECKLHINQNRFLLPPSPWQLTLDNSYYKRGIMVDVKHNYWGSPTGPKDLSNADGLFNPRGKGFQLADGFDYVPFTGETIAHHDELGIMATAPPLRPEQVYTISVTVGRFQLSSAPTGQIVVRVRDQHDSLLNGNGTIVSVNAQDTGATIPPINVYIPPTASSITVDAVLTPDGEDNTYSNVVAFQVEQPPSEFQLVAMEDIVTGYPFFLKLIPGNTIRTKIFLTYTHSTGDIHFSVQVLEKEAGGSTLTTFPVETFTTPPGINQLASHVWDIAVPIATNTCGRHNWYEVTVTAADDAGDRVGYVNGRFPVQMDANSLHITSSQPISVNGQGVGSRHAPFFITGEIPQLGAILQYKIATEEVTNWGAAGSFFEFRGNHEESVVTRDVFAQLHGFATGSGPASPIPLDAYRSTSPLRNDTRQLVFSVLMLDAGNGCITSDTASFEVRPPPTRTTSRPVPPGASDVDLKPVIEFLSYSSNSQARTIEAQEFDGQFGATARSSSFPSTQAAADLVYRFIPIKRYWSVFDSANTGPFAARLTLKYDPVTDFPASPGFAEDSLVVCGFNRLSNELEELPSTLDKSAHTVTTDLDAFFDTYVIASRTTQVFSPVRDPQEITPAGLFLEQSFPNPSTRETNIPFTLSRAADVSFDVYNTCGARVATFAPARFEAGRHSRTWNIEAIPPGVYTCIIRGAGVSASRRVVVCE